MVLELFRLKNYQHRSRMFSVPSSMSKPASRPNQLLNCRWQLLEEDGERALAFTEFSHPLSA
jgi:hypothetical protein